MEKQNGYFINMTDQQILQTHQCPKCKAILRSNYEATTVTWLCGLFLCVGLACWVPFTVDGCKKGIFYCDNCKQNVREIDVHCCCL